MYCENCGKKFPRPRENWREDMWEVAGKLNELMQEAGMPVTVSGDNPLPFVDGMITCCDNPDMKWDLGNHFIFQTKQKFPCPECHGHTYTTNKIYSNAITFKPCLVCKATGWVSR